MFNVETVDKFDIRVRLFNDSDVGDCVSMVTMRDGIHLDMVETYSAKETEG